MDTILIGIAGGTGSGKTTLADKLVESFGRDEVSILRHDNYYKRHDDIPFEERAKLNYDHPDAFDTDLLCQHILELKAGKSIEMPLYGFFIRAFFYRCFFKIKRTLAFPALRRRRTLAFSLMASAPKNRMHEWIMHPVCISAITYPKKPLSFWAAMTLWSASM